jgi:acyl-coenzyme A thioesterase PaaI-like protein
MSDLPFPVRIPFAQRLGLRLHHWGQGEAELRLTLEDSHFNSFDVAHGGVLMTLLDVAMAHAGRSADTHGADPAADAATAGGSTARGVVTVEMKTSFLRPAQGDLRAVAKVLHRTATLAFCEARVLNGREQVCAHATGTFKYLPAMPARAQPPGGPR